MEDYSIGGLPPTCYYIHSFITPTEEQHVIKEIQRLPKSRWTVLSHRRLLSLPSPLTGPSRDTLIAAPLPAFLNSVVSRLKDQNIFENSVHKAPNHVLINEYKPGEGIMPHEDGPAYHPITATISLGGHTVLEIYKKNEHGEREVKPTWRILQEPRSLLVTTGDMYVDTLHGISEIATDEDLDPQSIINWNLLGNKDLYEAGKADRQTRISLTLRDVIRIAKVGGAMKFITKRP
ncbi:uncharacterized protein Z518_07991 [Rhinocladiella mackenziei CBS 650.93]|uniref:Fe2OG dioxygenase domain-containing protein n=1 Tax=Rhinocladiella mackenziei CBS 650.93 TaxID=1442369 RepID=A0A0D2FJE6_9EURO|nr:uncharacterized protein Z518_07991 [Rhinocladiella mackenziei CBS 650.93]KIX02052.1 hypothetical protein Z518_07991 [Rhinocladiella mackenziei CBS 650.93]